MNKPQKILVIRNDKLGDFMLAWPSYALIKKQYPDAEITALVPEYTATMAEQCEWIDDILIDEKADSFIKDISQLSKKIKDKDFDASISLFSESRTAFSLWLAGIKVRVGPATKLAQLFLNRRLKQKRSRSLKPEYEYNIDLIRYYIQLNHDSPVDNVSPPYLSFDPGEISTLRDKLMSDCCIANNTAIILIHPGTGGSAINLTLQHYAKLANCISGRHKVYFFISAGPGESETAKNLSKLIKSDHHIHISEGSIVDFCKLINIVDLYISGSTGPLHIAGALNIRTVAFYPTKRSATQLRWQTVNDIDKRLAFSINKNANIEEVDIDMMDACKKICKTYLTKYSH